MLLCFAIFLPDGGATLIILDRVKQFWIYSHHSKHHFKVDISRGFRYYNEWEFSLTLVVALAVLLLRGIKFSWSIVFLVQIFCYLHSWTLAVNGDMANQDPLHLSLTHRHIISSYHSIKLLQYLPSFEGSVSTFWFFVFLDTNWRFFRELVFYSRTSRVF